MTINEAINLAKENNEEIKKITTIPNVNWYYFFMNPLFWQSLGKVLNWKEKQFYQFEASHQFLGEEMPEWEWQARKFFNQFILKGKSAEEFFNLLTKIKKRYEYQTEIEKRSR